MTETVETSNDSGVIFYNHQHFSPLVFGLFEGKPQDSFALNAFLCVFSNSSLIDRSHTLDQGFKTKIINPLPELTASDGDNPSFAEICDRRAVQIVEQARSENRPIHVFWSGGIDSTTALVALLKNMDAADQKEYLTVFYNQESINEYPKFFSETIQPDLKAELIDESYGFLLGNPILVTGELGDQLFGSVIMDELLNLQGDRSHIDIFRQPYKTVMPKLIQHRLKTHDMKLVSRLLDYLEPVIQRCPWRIVSTFDCLWWMNFILKWQHVDQRFAVGFHLDSPDLKQSYELCAHFFKTDDFQRWSMSNPDLKIKDTWATYKFPAKEYMFEFTRDRDYLENKNKVPSISLRKIKKSRHCFMLEDFRMINAEDTLNLEGFRQKYGEAYDWLFH